MGAKRILLKVSGEALGGDSGAGLDPGAMRCMAGECLAAVKRGVQVGLVVGGGNFLRGTQLSGLDVERVTGDQMGMLATLINGLALRDQIEHLGGRAEVFSAIEARGAAAPFDRRRCLESLRHGAVVILAGGTGNPFFTTDTAAALRAAELGADLFFKATKVDGVYDDDPKKNPQARRFEKLTYMDVLNRQLKVMDATAVSLCMDNKIPIVVFDMTREGNVGRLLDGESIGTVIS